MGYHEQLPMPSRQNREAAFRRLLDGQRVVVKIGRDSKQHKASLPPPIDTVSDEPWDYDSPPTPEDLVARKELLSVVRAAIEELSQRERYVLEAYFGVSSNRPFTLKQIAGDIGLSVERTRQIRNAALCRIRKVPAIAALFDPRPSHTGSLPLPRLTPTHKQPRPPEKPWCVMHMIRGAPVWCLLGRHVPSGTKPDWRDSERTLCCGWEVAPLGYALYRPTCAVANTQNGAFAFQCTSCGVLVYGGRLLDTRTGLFTIDLRRRFHRVHTSEGIKACGPVRIVQTSAALLDDM